MMEQHKQMIRDLMQGKLDLNNAPHEAAYQSQAASRPAPTEPKEAAPAPKLAPAEEKPPPLPPKEEVNEKGLDDIILDFLAQEQQDREKKE